jgi:alpha-tubulin suppressor-like RCC1 family protein
MPVAYGPLMYMDVRSCHSHCTASHFVVIDDSHNAYCIGRNEKGQLGNGSTDPSDVPVFAMSNILHAACGRNHTLLATGSSL